MSAKNDYKQRFEKMIIERGGRVIGVYINSKTSVKCICPMGHPCDTRPDCVFQGRGMCRSCSGRDPIIGKQRFENRIAELQGTIIGSYINNKTSVQCLCKQKHTCNPTPNDVLTGRGMCSICARNDKDASAARFYHAVEITYGGRVIGDYVNTNTPIYCICPWGHDWWPRPTNVLSHMTICRQCSVEHTVFYIVSDDDKIKLGVSSNNGASRLSNHRADGYDKLLFFKANLPTGMADKMEVMTLRRLKENGINPLRGREYFGPEAKDVVMRFVQSYADSEPFWGGN